MADIWSQLPKTQDDPTTIDQAIAAAIAEHEADPESHMGAGESIENHRTNDIIDHPQGSVVADKKSVGQLEIATNFESVTGWTITAATKFNELGNLYIASSSTINNLAYATLEDGLPVRCQDFNKNVIFQAVFEIGQGAVSNFDLVLALLGEINSYLGLGFRVENLTLKGVFYDGTDLHTVSLATLSRDTVYVVRAFNNSASGNVEFWVNGVLIDTVPYEQNYTSDENLAPYFSAKKISGTGTANLLIHQLFVARDY